MTGQSLRFDAAAAWSRLTPGEQEEIGALALKATVCVLAAMPGLPGCEAWSGQDPDKTLEEVETALDVAVQAALLRIGAITANTTPPPPLGMEETP